MRRFCFLAFGITLSWLASAPARAEIQTDKDADGGRTNFTLRHGDTTVKIQPEAGANVFSIRYKGAELLKTPESLKDLPGFMYGVPVLYPTPNRVREGIFNFGDHKYQFTPNNEGNFLHGLVHSAAWEVVEQQSSPESAPEITLRLKFAPGSEHYKLFPHEHELRLNVQVLDDGLRWTYTVDNTKGKTPVPFGFALHPWFLYQGPRDKTFVTIPAASRMDSIKMLPTGKLLDVAGTDFDARQPKSLANFSADDVYFGMRESTPAVIDFRGPKFKIILSASDDFTHLVLYTPPEKPWFCVENQTCSTDAHNLFAKGLTKESHLQVVEPGHSASGHVDFRFESY